VVKPDLAASIQRTLQQLSPEKQEALRDFAEFLLQQTRAESRHEAARERFIARFIDAPITIADFKPLTRDDLYRR
jgi:molecular chaperone GrpE (heat shock protein)